MSHEPNVPIGAGREFDLVRSMLRRWGDVASGVGDDAAILDVAKGERLVVSTDTAVENVHFRRAWLTPGEIGYRSTAAALSDLAAMAARPIGLLLALTVPERWLVDVEALADGVGDAALTHSCSIVGGDVTRGETLSLTVTVLGGASSPIRRGAIRPGDSIYVTGVLGGSLLALRAFERNESPMPAHRERFARPRARLREAQWLAAHGAHAMIDISDGLAAELGHLAAASGVELRIDADRIPVTPGGTLLDAAGSGEEYELVVAAPPQGLDVDAFARSFGISLTEIGRALVADHPAVRAYRGDTRVDLGLGHDHFTP